jgi:hypothetical protein
MKYADSVSDGNREGDPPMAPEGEAPRAETNRRRLRHFRRPSTRLPVAGRSFARTITAEPFGKHSIGLPISSSAGCGRDLGGAAAAKEEEEAPRRNLGDYDTRLIEKYRNTLRWTKSESSDTSGWRSFRFANLARSVLHG